MIDSVQRPTRDKTRLAHLPTPLEPLPALTRSLGGPGIWIKRDDCTGLASGGNKARKLEYLVHDALLKGADTLVTAGGIQSNHARQTAAAAARLGLKCILVLTDSVPGQSRAYHQGGNVLLDRLFGASIRLVDGDVDPLAAMADVAAACERAGGHPYVIPVGGSNAIGARAYVEAAGEMLDQAKMQGLHFSHVVLPTGSGGTHAGLAAGFTIRDADTKVIGISVSRAREDASTRVADLTRETFALLGIDRQAPEIWIDDRFIGAGYGLPTIGMVDAVRQVAQTEGLLLDPVYTGKAMAGLVALVAEKRLTDEHKVLFWHTGGSVALFAYEDAFCDAQESAVGG
jgi:D-cysteine desulfhydrase family pyridoxal phosphate-dependent enzyme